MLLKKFLMKSLKDLRILHPNLLILFCLRIIRVSIITFLILYLLDNLIKVKLS